MKTLEKVTSFEWMGQRYGYDMADGSNAWEPDPTPREEQLLVEVSGA